MQSLHLHDAPFEPVPHEVRLLLIDPPAGFPSPAADDLEELIDLGSWLIEHPAASYAMRVAAEPMTGPGINDGDYIVVSRSVAPKPGHTVVAAFGDRTLKRLRKMDGRLWLVPEAEGYGYTKAGIMLDDLVAAELRPRTLFEGDTDKRTRLMGALDDINGWFGRFTTVPAAQGFKREWKMGREPIAGLDNAVG